MVIVEVQLTVDPQKRFSWPAYAVVSRAVHACPVALLVMAPDPLVAEWCAQPIEIGIPGFVLRPPVLRRTAIPVVTDPEEAARRPELGVLSAMAHGETEEGATIAAAVLPAIRGLDDDRSRFYHDLVYHSLNEASRGALEVLMKGPEEVPGVSRRRTPPEAQPRRHFHDIHGLDRFEGLGERFRPGRAFRNGRCSGCRACFGRRKGRPIPIPLASSEQAIDRQS